MYRCLKFITFCDMVVSQMCKSLYILSVHEDDKSFSSYGSCIENFSVFQNCEVFIKFLRRFV